MHYNTTTITSYYWTQGRTTRNPVTSSNIYYSNRNKKDKFHILVVRVLSMNPGHCGLMFALAHYPIAVNRMYVINIRRVGLVSPSGNTRGGIFFIYKVANTSEHKKCNKCKKSHVQSFHLGLYSRINCCRNTVNQFIFNAEFILHFGKHLPFQNTTYLYNKITRSRSFSEFKGVFGCAFCVREEKRNESGRM